MLKKEVVEPFMKKKTMDRNISPQKSSFHHLPYFYLQTFEYAKNWVWKAKKSAKNSKMPKNQQVENWKAVATENRAFILG